MLSINLFIKIQDVGHLPASDARLVALCCCLEPPTSPVYLKNLMISIFHHSIIFLKLHHIVRFSIDIILPSQTIMIILT